jgi:Tfp pilus assembly protein FimT
LFAKKGFSTVELITVSAVLSIVITLWYFAYSQTRMSADELEDEQSFQALSSALVGELRRDIRSSFTINPTGPNRWEIETVSTDITSLPVKATVVYELSADQQKVYVTRSGKVKTYDFSETTDGKKITFNIVP